jgi:drug/metabolite transporter (DMT)-like permease
MCKSADILIAVHAPLSLSSSWSGFSLDTLTIGSLVNTRKFRLSGARFGGTFADWLKKTKFGKEEIRMLTDRDHHRLGIVMMCVGEMGNFSAFSFAPASLIAPLGCVSVLSNITVAHFLLKERMRLRDLIGIVIATLSATGIVIISPSVRNAISGLVLSDLTFVVFFCCCCFAGRARVESVHSARVYVTAAVYHLQHYSLCCDRYVHGAGATVWPQVRAGSCDDHLDAGVHHRDVGERLLDLYPSEHSGRQPVPLLAHVRAHDHRRRNRRHADPVRVALHRCDLRAHSSDARFLNMAMQHFEASVVTPTVFVLFTVFTIAGSLILYKEFAGMPALHIVLFVIGCLYTFAGVYLITGDRTPPVRRSFDTQTHQGLPSLCLSVCVALVPDCVLRQSRRPFSARTPWPPPRAPATR